MIIAFVVIVLLLALLLIPNALYAFRKFLEDRNLIVFCVYLGFLVMLAYLVIHVTMRLGDIVQNAKEVYTEPAAVVEP